MIVVGAIIGPLARLILPGKQTISLWLTLVIGVVAAWLGAFLVGVLGLSVAATSFDWLELLLQISLAAIGIIVAGSYNHRGAGQ